MTTSIVSFTHGPLRGIAVWYWPTDFGLSAEPSECCRYFLTDTNAPAEPEHATFCDEGFFCHLPECREHGCMASHDK